jgi:Na+(H+)/acetate symporter ActP
MFAISLPVFVLMSVYGGYGKNLDTIGRGVPAPTQVVAAGAAVATGAEVTRLALPAKAPADDSWVNPFGPLTTKAAKAAKMGPAESRPYALLYTYSLIIALVCGTAGLPHILVRFYTNPDGVAAKRTTMWVMILIGVFYVFPPVFGVLGRNWMPEIYEGVGVNGTDGIVLKLPVILQQKYGMLGSVLSGITCAGAFAAFMSTFSGLLVSMTGALAHDVYGRILRPNSTPAERMRMFKFAAVAIGVVAMFLGSLVENFEINFMVGQAFAIAAASYFPLLFMSVWWRGMTVQGAATGMLTGGMLAVGAISLTSWTTFITTQAAKFKAIGKVEPGWFVAIKPYSMVDYWAAHPLLRILCEQPAIWAVPLAIGLMIVVSKLTSASVPADIRMKMLVLHAPEKLGLKQEYIREHEAHGH